MPSQFLFCSGSLRGFYVPFVRGLFSLHIAPSMTILVIHNMKSTPTIGPVGLLIPNTTLLQACAMLQDVVQLLLHLVVPITGSVCRRTKKLHASIRVTIRLHGQNLASHIREMIHEGERRREVVPFAMLQMSIKIPHDMSYGKGTAELTFLDIFHLAWTKRGTIGDL